MWDSAYMTPESSDIAMALMRHKVLDIRRQNGKVLKCINLPKPTAFLSCEEIVGRMKERLAALEGQHDSDGSE